MYPATRPAQEHILPSPVLGRARWIGFAPRDLEALEILAPRGSVGEIRIDSIAPLSALQLAGTLLRQPTAMARFIYSRFAGVHATTVFLRSLLDLAPLTNFADFRRTRTRAFEPAGLDAAVTSEARIGPVPCFVVVVGSEDVSPLVQTLASLGQQVDAGFRVLVGLHPGAHHRQSVEHIHRSGLADRAEIVQLTDLDSPARVALSLACASSAEWVGWLKPGDRLSPEATLILRDFLAGEPSMRAVYADSVASPADSSTALPELKPDWSPTYLDQIDYVGRPCLFRRHLLEAAVHEIDDADPDPWWTALRLVGRGRSRGEMAHLKRLLLEHAPVTAPKPRALPSSPYSLSSARKATIVIPTRDRLDLLQRAVSSILKHSGQCDNCEILIVDNESVEADTLTYLSAIDDSERVRVLRRPGPFNFPDLINAGAEAAEGDLLVLLNNDCEARDGTWIAAMASLALQPDVGAVGAKLLYEDGRLQHAGVALGLGGEAGHRDRKLPADHPGNLNRLKVVHEVSAVTAACLAVERRKFEEIGGFDRAFAVAFNDIDFCLRLQVRGYRNLLSPHAVLTHAESASRGRDSGPKRARFEAEAALFRERWLPLIHDDPFFHPLFSTTRFADHLG
ncbi:glycosyltransferase family 2 protein [Enterovirga aerilata]|uniref:Glycosyltransferase n=1 Tax=Enterovirga aerilata TaxID=2730920 RepID=A0A849IDM5_9HYPH|nr:glycosyltransferase [Enterovirga sp. DB1703]NNM74539.1 glycosyltransferase [Enterovirga sp. DB1703]